MLENTSSHSNLLSVVLFSKGQYFLKLETVWVGRWIEIWSLSFLEKEIAKDLGNMSFKESCFIFLYIIILDINKSDWDENREVSAYNIIYERRVPQ